MTIVMPDLARNTYFAREPRPFTDERRDDLWSQPDYGRARSILRRRELVPAVSLEECVQILDELGLRIEQVEVVPVGIESAWRGEVVGQFPPAGAKVTEGSPVRLFVSHPSLRGRLPEGFVAEAGVDDDDDSSWDDSDLDVFAERREIARREEPPAARMLRGFDAEIWRSRLELHRTLSVFEGLAEDLPLARQLLFWIGSDSDKLDQDRVRWIGNSLWMLSEATGPSMEMADLLGVLVNAPVRFEDEAGVPLPLPSGEITPLGDARCVLGAGGVLGDCLDDRGGAVSLVVGPLEVERAAELARDPEFGRLVSIWVRALLPVLTSWRLRFELKAKRRLAPAIGAAESGAVLGVTTELNSQTQ